MIVRLDPFKRITNVSWPQADAYYIFAQNGDDLLDEAFVGEHDETRSVASTNSIALCGLDVLAGPTSNPTVAFDAFNEYIEGVPGVRGVYVLTNDSPAGPFESWQVLAFGQGFLPFGVAAGVTFFGAPDNACPPAFYFHGRRQATEERCLNFSEWVRSSGTEGPYRDGSHTIVRYEYLGDPEEDFEILSCTLAP